MKKREWIQFILFIISGLFVSYFLILHVVHGSVFAKCITLLFSILGLITFMIYNKTKDKAKAKEELLKCDLSELDSFDKDVKKVINEILGENKKTVNTAPNKEQTSKTDNKLVQKK